MRKTVRRAAILTSGVALLAAAAVIRKRRKYDLAGRNVFITGGSRGLGLLLAQEFSHRGACVAICARDSEELGRARLALLRRGFDPLTVVCDLSVQEDVERAVQSTREILGSLDVLVNNAGTVSVGPMDVMSLEDYQESLDTHFWVRCIQLWQFSRKCANDARGGSSTFPPSEGKSASLTSCRTV